MPLSERIVVDAEILAGKPVIRAPVSPPRRRELPEPIVEALRAEGHDVLWARTDHARMNAVTQSSEGVKPLAGLITVASAIAVFLV